MKVIIVFVGLLMLMGCSSTPPESASGEQPVRYARYVQVAVFDSTQRTATDKLSILREPPSYKHRVIATLTIDGSAEDEGKLLNALAWKARQLGAESLVLLKPDAPYQAWNNSASERAQRVFRAEAIISEENAR